MSAFACLVVPFFSAAAVERVEPALRERALAVVTGSPPATRVVDANAVAHAAGVGPRMTEAEARARCPELVARALPDEVRQAARHALLDAALCVSPRVEDAGEGVVYVDASGLERLVGDARAVGRRLVREARGVGFTATVGLGESRAVACVAARLGPTITVVEADRERETLAHAPLALLDPDPATMAMLTRWGVRTLGQLAALPRDGLAVRLGAAGMQLHDRACGIDRAPFRPYAPPAFYQEGQGLEWEVDTLGALQVVLDGILERLCARLEAGHLAADVLDVDLRLASGERHHRRVPLAHPLLDPKSMRTLLALDLEAHPPTAAVTSVAITAHPVRTVAGQGGLWHPTMPALRELAAVLTRLAGLVGPDAVGSPMLVDSHRPDAIALTRFDLSDRDPRRRWGQDARGAPPRAAGTLGGVRRHPEPSEGPQAPPTEDRRPHGQRGLLAERRLRPARAIEVEREADVPRAVRWNDVRYEVTGCAGPWRRSGDWWDVDGWARDEWDVSLDDGTVCRIAHDLRSGGWLLDAVYD